MTRRPGTPPRQLARAATVSIERRPDDDPDVVECVTRYVAELDRRTPGGFRLADGDALLDPGGHYLLAVSQGRPVAVGGVRALPLLSTEVSTAEVKRMWVAEDWRGAGLGARMLRHLERRALDLGHRRVLLDTKRHLTEAVTLYERAGYREVERYNDNAAAELFFEKTLPDTVRAASGEPDNVAG
ncbi:GNAT family N-acetyltransferase [Nocardioides acrostichi]|uniref:GNAT family N-acetyltransferase n=1 Tax=Nocardioides acrostichi TaxID=2784339 RepID=A0A930Y5P9_9ACTN|nr:GNAT family N-acetyltransferase [Nocardioides acrostichi]MBF4160116.1 GNAT family N-acetyltransferase [Nocardioides acrostichi]